MFYFWLECQHDNNCRVWDCLSGYTHDVITQAFLQASKRALFVANEEIT